MPLPIYQHPSLTVLVDDSAAFLARLQCELGEAVTSMAFTDPHQAKRWLRAQHAAAPREQLMAASASAHQDCGVALDLGALVRIGCRPERFMLPSVLVVDHHMAAIDGVVFCAGLADLPCKKILLYGAGGEGAMLDAFNRGLIDRAINKSDHDALDQLARAIAALQFAYFMQLSAALRAPLALNGFGFLDDPAVARLLRIVSAEHAIVEHYLYPQPGGLLLHDAAGRARLMIIESSAGMEAQYEVARDSGAPPSLLKSLEARCIIPFFRNGDGMYADTVGERWYRYCEPAQVCTGTQAWYWALFDLGADELPQAAAPFTRFQESRRG